MEERIWAVIKRHARLKLDLASLTGDSDLYDAGMTSHASVNVMLGLEHEFDIEFPNSMLKRSVFASVSSIAAAVRKLVGQQVA
jgi:acyl carrier protein